MPVDVTMLREAEGVEQVLVEEWRRPWRGRGVEQKRQRARNNVEDEPPATFHNT